MKKITFGFMMVVLFLLAGNTATAQMGMMGNYYGQPYGSAVTTTAPVQNSELNSALQNIYKTQAIDSQAKIDCSKVTDGQFNNLGDAYMGIMLPNQQQHTVMDNMMGGEGSTSLNQAHINMGRSYLGCWSNYNSGPVYMPTMGGYYGANQYNGNTYAMMYGNGIGYPAAGGFYGYSVSNMIFMGIVLVLAIFGLVMVIKWILDKSKKS